MTKPRRSGIAKLSAPRLHSPVARIRLYELLDSLRAHPLIWVNGPPGAGKTALVASWADARGMPCLWYQMDAGDTDTATFFYYLVALAQLAGGGSTGLPYLTPEYLLDLPGFTRRFFQAFFAGAPRGSVLVFDNAQEAAGGVLHLLLREAVSQVPGGCNLLVLTRAQPPVELAKLTANRDLVTLDWPELRLTEAETWQIVERSGLGAPPTGLQLHERIDGWVAGLMLLLAHLRRAGAERSLTSMASRESLFAYFAGEIFDAAPPHERELLMLTALAPQVTAGMAVTLCSDPQAPELLNRLYRLQYFTDRRTEPELSYRYHDLFREFLLARAQRIWGNDRLRINQVRAAEQLLSCGQADDAIALFLSASAHQRVAELVLEQAPSMLAKGRWATLQSWIQALPDVLIDQQPWVTYWLGTSYIPVDQPRAQRLHIKAYTEFLALGDRRGQLLALCGIADAITLMLHDLTAIDRWLPLLETLVGDLSPELSDDEQFRAYSSLLAAMFWRHPGHSKFQATREHLRQLISNPDNARFEFAGGLQVAQAFNHVGEWADAREVMAVLLPALDSGRCTPLIAAAWCAFAGYHYYVMGQDGLARQWLSRSENIALTHNMPQTAARAQLYWVLLAVAMGDVDTATEVLGRAESCVQLDRGFDRAVYRVARARAAALKGERDHAVEESRLAVVAGDATHSPLIQIVCYSVAASVLADFGHYDESAACIAGARRAGADTPIHTFDAYLLLLEAYLSLVWRHDGRHLALLQNSLDVAREQHCHYGYRTFSRHIPALMLDIALRKNMVASWVVSIIDELHLRPAPGVSAQWPWAVKVWTLGGFRLEVAGKNVTFGRKIPKKPLALLQCLIAFDGEAVPETRIVDALWPDAEGDSAHHRLALSLHRLRQLLGSHDCVHLQNQKLSLNLRRIWIDTLWLEREINCGYDATGTVDVLPTGEFLAGEPEEPWVLMARKRLRRLDHLRSSH